MEEIIKHYQCILPRKVEQSGQLLSILAFVISVLALLLSETVIKSAENIAGAIIILVMVALLYLIAQSFNRNVLKVFSKDSLYERIESSLAEIFMIWYLKKDKMGEK